VMPEASGRAAHQVGEIAALNDYAISGSIRQVRPIRSRIRKDRVS